MATDDWDRIDAAQLLREVAAELVAAEGVARNGLFLELHRLQDTIFRRALEEHPDAPPALAALAFAVSDALPAPQVVRELNNLRSDLVTPDIRSLYRGMNAARNAMAHNPALGRVTVSRANARTMARLARLLADRLDPAQEGQPASPRQTSHTPAQTGNLWARKALYLVVGLAAGAALAWGWLRAPNDALFVALAVGVAAAVAAVVWWEGRQG